MPPLRPLVRTFAVPSSAATTSHSRAPILAAVSAIPRAALPQAIDNNTACKSSQTVQVAGFSSSSRALSGAGESHYDPPTGWLWGIPPGEKREPEGWEKIWVWGFWGGLGLAAVAYAYKPDTSIQTWALEEARRRLEAEGILPDPDNKDK